MKKNSLRAAALSTMLMGAISLGILSAPAASAAPVAIPAAVNTVVPATAYSDPFTKQTFDLINAERVKVGSKPFIWNQKIADVSQDWSEKLGVATKEPDFDWAKIHRADAGGSLIPSGATMYRENIAFNFTPAQIVDWWMNSAGHKAAMLDPRLTDAGLGYVVPTSGPYKGWHMVVSNMATYPQNAATKTPLAIKAASYNGSIGTAYGAEVFGLKGNGSYQCFPGGCLIYSPATGAHLTTGAIRGAWAETGFENGFLGYPTTDEVAGLRSGGVYQCYQGGCIMWSPATGAHISTGGIRSVWASTGYENGPLGYPVTNEVGGLKDGGVYQCYEGGCVMWSPATGGFVSMGGIRTIWASTGFESGRLGYPTSNEYATGGGNVAQNYQGGVIKWGPAGTGVTYK